MAKEDLFETITPERALQDEIEINGEHGKMMEKVPQSITEQPKEKQLAPIMPTLPVPKDLTKEDWLMVKILDSGQVGALEKYMQVRREEQDRQSKRLFDENFAIMQGKYIAVERTREVWDRDHTKIIRKYAALDDILLIYAPIIASHGFSYHWNEEAIADKPDMKRVFCVVAGYGFERSGYIDIPIMEGNSFTNAAQQSGSSTGYGKRLSFINAFGVIIKDEDNDAQFEAGTVLALSSETKKISDCKTLDELGKVFQEVYNAKKAQKELDAETKKTQLNLIIRAKDEKKKELTPPENDGAKK